jgi:hypothetical protein
MPAPPCITLHDATHCCLLLLPRIASASSPFALASLSLSPALIAFF